MTRFFSTVLLAAILAPTAAAQHAKAIENWANLNQLVKGTEIRVTLVTGATQRGFLQSVTPESLTINAATSQPTVSRQDIRRVALKRFRPSRSKHAHRVGDWNGRRPGRWRRRGCPGGPRQLAAERRQSGVCPLGALIGTVVGVALPTGGWHDVYRAL